MVAAILALPGTVTAPAFLILSAMLGSIGFASGSLAANERLFRLIQGPAVIRHHAQYMARTSGAMTIGQLIGAGAVAFGYPAFVALYVASATARVVAFRTSRPVPADADDPSGQALVTGSAATAESGASAVA
jgi:hypothetical protein